MTDGWTCAGALLFSSSPERGGKETRFSRDVVFDGDREWGVVAACFQGKGKEGGGGGGEGRYHFGRKGRWEGGRHRKRASVSLVMMSDATTETAAMLAEAPVLVASTSRGKACGPEVYWVRAGQMDDCGRSVVPVIGFPLFVALFVLRLSLFFAFTRLYLCESVLPQTKTSVSFEITKSRDRLDLFGAQLTTQAGENCIYLLRSITKSTKREAFLSRYMALLRNASASCSHALNVLVASIYSSL